MQLSTTFRHMDASQSVRACAQERLDRIRKYLQRDPIAVHAVFSVARNHNHTAEFQITLPNGVVIQARETTEDMYSSIDLAAARIERQVRKWKDKVRDHKPHGVTSPPPAPATRVARGSRGRRKGAQRVPQLAKAGAGRPAVAPAGFTVVQEPMAVLRAMRVADAVAQVGATDTGFLVFANVDTGGVSVVYRRKDGNYGLVDTATHAPGV